ncbi:MAG: putative phenylacetic acid degradation-related protein [Candidatus Binatia bacterium]|nr:MAG: putative phenylacetic acid degradation-related protein [Candidatus Binatia bacterium]
MAATFEHFDRKVAEAMIEANARDAGLPRYLGVRFVRFEPGRLVAEAPVRPEFLTPFGTMHGGIMAALVDHVLGCVLYPLMQRGQWAATTEFKLNYLAPVRSGTIVAESQVVAFTRTTAVVRVEVTNEERLVAVALGTLLVRDPKGKEPSS